MERRKTDNKSIENHRPQEFLQHQAPKRLPACHVDDCKKSYTRRQALIDLLRSHNGCQPFQCPRDGCTERFVKKGDCCKHEARVHDGRRDHVCGGMKDQAASCNCGRAFASMYELKRHQGMRKIRSPLSLLQKATAARLGKKRSPMNAQVSRRPNTRPGTKSSWRSRPNWHPISR